MGGEKVTCASALALGVDTSATGGEGTVHFSKCESSDLACKSVKPAASVAGEVIVLVTSTVKKLTSVEDTVLTTILEPGTKNAGEIEVECSGIKIKLRGSFYSNAIPINLGLKTLWPVSATQTKGVQHVLKDEAGVEAKVEVSIEGKPFEGSGREGTGITHLLEEGEFV